MNDKTLTTAMVLAAGRGERLRPITDTLPKPLVEVGGCTLLERHLQRLVAAGIRRIVINVAYLPDLIKQAVARLSLGSVEIYFSEEPVGALETAGGIIQALPVLAAERFLVVNADIWTDYDFHHLVGRVSQHSLAHLVMVDKPKEKAAPDFYLDESGLLHCAPTGKGLTFAGISVLRSTLFTGCSPGRLALRPLLEKAIERQRVTAEYFAGEWHDVGTLERLEFLRNR